MPVFEYLAKKDPQHTIEGKIDAASEKEALEKLNQLNLVPISLKETAVLQSRAAQLLPQARSRMRVSSREITVFTRQLASLLKSGVPILKALLIIKDQSENRNLKSILQSIYREVEAGSPFSSVLAQYPKVFVPLYIALVRAGEDSGALSTVLFKIAQYRVKQEEVITKFRMAMVYPVLMVLVGIGTMVFMLTFVMPKLMKLYKDMGQTLPVPTKILIGVSNLLAHNGLWVLAVVAMVIIVVQRYGMTKSGKVAASAMKLALPVVGPLIVKAELARFARTLELLLRSGIPILRAITITVPVLSNEIIKSQLNASYKELEQGGSLGRSLKNSNVVPGFMSNLVIVGEESGKLDDALMEVAASYEGDTEEAIGIMSSLVEPMMILVMGLIVGFMVIAMLLPIFDINVMVR